MQLLNIILSKLKTFFKKDRKINRDKIYTKDLLDTAEHYWFCCDVKDLRCHIQLAYWLPRQRTYEGIYDHHYSGLQIFPTTLND